MNLANRIAGAERAMSVLRPGLREIVIRGGLTADAWGDFATVDGRRVDRGPVEDVETFQIRVRKLAQAAGAKLVVYGGLPAWPSDRDEGVPA
jgi:hypothetical protein